MLTSSFSILNSPPHTQVQLMRDPERLDKDGKPRSLGWAFVEFHKHDHALEVCSWSGAGGRAINWFCT